MDFSLLNNLPETYVVNNFYSYAGFPTYNRHDNNYIGCCPVCREGNSWGRKKRLYYFPHQNYLYCHNCGESWNPADWIKEVSDKDNCDILNEVKSEEYPIDLMFNDDDFVVEHENNDPIPEDSIDLTDKQQVLYYKDEKVVLEAIKFIRNRRLNTAINKPDAYYLSLVDKIHKNRLCIPFKDVNGNIIHYQTRELPNYKSFDGSPNYLSKKYSDKSLFNIDKVDPNLDNIYITEGPIDAMFVKNGIANCGITKKGREFNDFQRKQIESFWMCDIVWVLDSQWIDNTSLEATEKMIEKGYKVFIWPKELGTKVKDINELCMKKQLDEFPQKILQKYTFEGLSAQMELSLIQDYVKQLHSP